MSRPFSIPPEPTIRADVIEDAALESISADELLAVARRTPGRFPPEVMRRAARRIELLRLELWQAQRRLAISEAARSVEAADRVAEPQPDEGNADVLPDSALAAILAAVPPGGRLHLTFERQPEPIPACSPCSNVTITS